MKKLNYFLAQNQLLDLTDAVQAHLKENNIQEGCLVLQTDSASACLFCLPEEPAQNLIADLFREVSNIVPNRITFSSTQSPSTTAGTLKGVLFGQPLTVLICDGAPVFDAKVYLIDFCAPKDISIALQVVPTIGGMK